MTEFPHLAPRPDGERGGPDPRETGEMPFLAHLEELRRVLFRSVIGAVAGMLVGWWLAPRVLEDLIRRTVHETILLTPLEGLNERIKLALILGVVVASPYLFYQIWSFVAPGLFKREKRWVMPMAVASMILFGLGVWAAYGYVVPLVVQVLSQFMTPGMKMQIQLGELTSFTYNMALACGLVFQLPLVLMTLTAIGLVTPRFLLKQWRIAIVLTFVVTAVITPGDVVTAQLVMGIPMVALYFLSVGLSWFVWRRRQQARTPQA